MQNEDQPKRGRPSDYSAEIAETICDRLVNGASLRAICADPAMPARATVFRWLARNQKFCTLSKEAFRSPAFDDLRRLRDKLGSMLSEVLLGSDDKVAMGEVRGPQTLGLKPGLRSLHRTLKGKGVGGEGHACVELGEV